MKSHAKRAERQKGRKAERQKGRKAEKVIINASLL